MRVINEGLPMQTGDEADIPEGGVVRTIIALLVRLEQPNEFVALNEI